MDRVRTLPPLPELPEGLLVSLANTSYELACTMMCVCTSWGKAARSPAVQPRSLSMAAKDNFEAREWTDVVFKVLAVKPLNGGVKEITIENNESSYGDFDCASVVSMMIGVGYPQLQQLRMTFVGGAREVDHLRYLPEGLRVLSLDCSLEHIDRSIDLDVFNRFSKLEQLSFTTFPIHRETCELEGNLKLPALRILTIDTVDGSKVMMDPPPMVAPDLDFEGIPVECVVHIA